MIQSCSHQNHWIYPVCWGSGIGVPVRLRLDHHFIDNNPVGFSKTHDGLGFEVTGQIGFQKSRGAQHVEDKGDVAGIAGVIQLLQLPNGLSCHVHYMAVDLGGIFPIADMVGIDPATGKGSYLINNACHVFE